MDTVDTRIPETPQGFVKIVASGLDSESAIRYVAIQAIAEIIIGVNRTAGTITLSLLTQLADGRNERLRMIKTDADAFMHQVNQQLLPYQEPPKTQTQE